MDSNWWRQAVIYQIYPRSFADGNGDGIGDFKGVTSRIDYLQALGIDAVWFSPFYPSALKDGGYDVADYRNVDPRIGTLEDFDELMSALKEVGIKVIVDIVPNHTSDDHEWFRAAVKAGKGSAEREKYIFKDGTGTNKELPPSDWLSIFGGSAWSPSGADDGQWYFHWFDESQPDLNWHHPEIKEDFIKTLRFWGDRGVAGFRIDVAHGLVKDMTEPLVNWEVLVDMTHRKLSNGNADLDHPILDRDDVHDIYRSWRKVFNEYDPPLMAVAESWVAPDRKHLYASADGLGQAFSFDILLCNFDAKEYRKCIESSLRDATSSTTWVLSNHDVIRHATRLALPHLPNHDNITYIAACNNWLLNKFEGVDREAGLKRARAASMMILGLPGSTYVYQGEELGLPEISEIKPSERQDPSFRRTRGMEVGRDGCRVPLPWASTEPSFGFGSGTPHLPQPEYMGTYAVDVEEKEASSTLSLYRRAINLRKKLQCDEHLEWIDSPEGTLHFKRPNGWSIFVNISGENVALPAGELLLSSSPEEFVDRVPTATTVWLK